jgi:hypothetical protein
MEEKMMVLHCRVPSALVKDDIVPYVRRKLRGLPGLGLSTMSLLQYLPTLESGYWSASVRCLCETGAVRAVECNPIVRRVEKYMPPEPLPPYVPDPNDDDSGFATGGFGPLIEPFETMARIAKAVIFPPLDLAYAVKRKLRSRYYRHFT